MRLATLRTPDGLRAAFRLNNRWRIHPAPDVGALLRAQDWRDEVSRATTTLPDHVPPCFAPVLPSPGKIICVGLNYRSHIQETGRDFPAYPTLFSKYPEALVGANDCITLPATSSKMDWEIELAVVVGSPLRKADLATARRAIAGYTVANDVTARDWQYRSGQWMQGKTFEATCPFGPELVTADEVDDAKDLRLRCLVDGNEVQSGTTADLLFPPAELLSYVSVICTLQPGDVVLTGTTGGVGHARTPPEYLTDGQVLTTEIEGLGRCDNRCVAE